jgi:ribonuclease BN (tRNA processing enzyme)
MKCKFKGCSKAAKTRGLCSSHYTAIHQALKKGTFEVTLAEAAEGRELLSLLADAELHTEATLLSEGNTIPITSIKMAEAVGLVNPPIPANKRYKRRKRTKLEIQLINTFAKVGGVVNIKR